MTIEPGGDGLTVEFGGVTFISTKRFVVCVGVGCIECVGGCVGFDGTEFDLFSRFTGRFSMCISNVDFSNPDVLLDGNMFFGVTIG